MEKIGLIILAIFAGMSNGFQAPVNAALGRFVGVVESSCISFSVGALSLLVVSLIAGKGSFLKIVDAPPHLWINGFELLKLCVAKKIDAVMLTAHAFSVESLKESLDLGARAYLPKEKMADIVSFLEDVVTMEAKENWQRLFERLGGFLNASFGADWNKDLIEIGSFIVPE